LTERSVIKQSTSMSPRTKEQLKLLKNARKTQILLVALDLFGNKGYQNTSISDIAKKAKLSKGLLYNYFESKETLLNEVVIFAFKEATQMGEQLLYKIKDQPSDMVFRYMVESFFQMLKEEKDLWKLTISLAVQVSAVPSVKQSVMAIYEQLLGQLEALFTYLEYKNPKNEAMLLGAIIDGVSIQYILYGDAYPLEKMKNMIIDKYLNNKN